MNHIIQAQQFTPEFIKKIFDLANHLEMNHETPLKGKIMATLFYEPSTRTRFSFESAMLRLGGQVITTENAREFSSAAKGETLEDSIRVVSNYADVIVMRHFEEGAAERASRVASVPVINAGDGKGQHPTQALLDLYTINRELGGIDGITIAMAGDLKYGRTIRSLSYLLGKYKNVKIIFVSPEALRVGTDIKEYLKRHNTTYHETEKLEEVLPSLDVLYQTRIQKERFSDPAEYEKLKGCYQLTPALADRLPKHAIIMHPLPRVDEISPLVDASPKALYFKQTYYGLLVRMALLKFVLTPSSFRDEE
ncbi:MAG: aspartate carbamoyltransferase [Patescibacteria group bacterium]